MCCSRPGVACDDDQLPHAAANLALAKQPPAATSSHGQWQSCSKGPCTGDAALLSCLWRSATVQSALDMRWARHSLHMLQYRITVSPATACTHLSASPACPPPLPAPPAGMVYKHFGKEIIANTLKLPLNHPDVTTVYLQVWPGCCRSRRCRQRQKPRLVLLCDDIARQPESCQSLHDVDVDINACAVHYSCAANRRTRTSLKQWMPLTMASTSLTAIVHPGTRCIAVGQSIRVVD